jgi:hypothetical protein
MHSQENDSVWLWADQVGSEGRFRRRARTCGKASHDDNDAQTSSEISGEGKLFERIVE